MPKIKMEIDATSSELVEIILGLAKASVAKRDTKSVNLARANKLKATRIERRKKMSAQQATKPTMKGPQKGPPTRWGKTEERWLAQYIKTNVINRVKTPKDFYAQFGYKRSYSSLNGKAYELRKK
jgi:hypothetical protein